jgi:hypothetical protein
MVLSPTTEVTPLTVDANGVLRVGNTRATLDTVLAAFADGATAEEIVQQYPSLATTYDTPLKSMCTSYKDMLIKVR